MQKFTNFQEARLAARVLSFVLNDPVKLYATGCEWIIESEVEFYVALFIFYDIRKYRRDPIYEEIYKADEPMFWEADAMAAWNQWRKENAGTDGYRTVEIAASKLRMDSRMKKSFGYISPEQIAEWRYEDALEEEGNNAAKSAEDGERGYWNGYDWIYTKEIGDGND